MIGQASGFGMGVVRFSRLLRGVGVHGMTDAGLDTMRRVESGCIVPLGAGVLRLLGPGVGVGVIIVRHCAAEGVAVTG